MGVPKPLVQCNQSFIAGTVLTALVWHEIFLAVPLFVGLYSLITKQNPVMAVGKRFLSKPADQYIQEDKEQQRFNQWIAVICLGLSLTCFYLGWHAAGYVFSVMVLLAAGVALMGFCIGCTIRYRYMMWKYKKENA
ncbi:protein of unknown function [Alteribacillus persepolensis]|uniref:DUF4395 domain-containing protein n=1 Tax=Alteribacillus persepolensis TaxID=568899 RepID=A0A1G8JZE5_9BACI|nr:DUF4395 domain-containing protein [Alteribacillus persepolensis]SDI36561.1 protein of unknown function [Alteribacillus persepolensis]